MLQPVRFAWLFLRSEDEYLIIEYLRSILEGGGHTVIATFDADKAVRVLEKVSGHPARHHRHQHAGLHGRASIGGRHQGPMAPNSPNPGDRIGSAETQ